MAAAGNVDLGYSDAAPVTQLIAKDAPIKVIATLFQGSPIQITAKAGSGIEDITDLAGKTLAYPSGGSQQAQLPLVFAANGIDPESVELVASPRASLVPQLLEDQVDAIVGSMDFFGIQLADRGVETVDFPMYEYGAPTVSTSIIASEDWLAENPDTATKFVRASLRGWAEALENPEASIEALTSLFPNVDPEEAAKQLESTIPLYCANDANYLGKATEQAWVDHERVLRESGSIEQEVDPAEIYTYDFLPPEEELTPCP
jgi:NitT/TauT family transport system substrate-binding protein